MARDNLDTHCLLCGLILFIGQHVIESCTQLWTYDVLFCSMSDYRSSNGSVEYLRETAHEAACVCDVMSVDYVN